MTTTDQLGVPFGPLHPGDTDIPSSVFATPDGSPYEPPDADTLTQLLRLTDAEVTP